nr:rod shape-determining protein RodA [Desulfobacterales bacterium]
MFDRRLIKHFDWILLIIALTIAVIGILNIYSATTANPLYTKNHLWLKQLYWLIIGSAVMCFVFLFDYRLLERWAFFIYGFSMIMLIAVLFWGKAVCGSKRWLVLGPVSFQPSEVVKIAIIIVLARYFSGYSEQAGFGFREIRQPSILTLIPFALLVEEPDLGTAVLILLIAGSIALFCKIKTRLVLSLVLLGIISFPVQWAFLKGYQRQRILTFINPEEDPLGNGYHTIQSIIAVGSGKVFGKGYLKGTQNYLAFLPEQHTDFIFSVLAEEWGFVGSSVVIFLFLALVVRGLKIAIRSREPFGTILAFGISIMIFWQIFINVGMAMGILPVVGVPLPLISYGGSSVIMVMGGIGILMNVSMRRFMFQE